MADGTSPLTHCGIATVGVIGSGREQVLAIGILFVAEAPPTDDDLELRILRTQTLAEMSRLAQASWGHRPDAEKRGAVQVDVGEHFGHQHPGPAHLHPVPRRVDQMSQHRDRQREHQAAS